MTTIPASPSDAPDESPELETDTGTEISTSRPMTPVADEETAVGHEASKSLPTTPTRPAPDQDQPHIFAPSRLPVGLVSYEVEPGRGGWLRQLTPAEDTVESVVNSSQELDHQERGQPEPRRVRRARVGNPKGPWWRRFKYLSFVGTASLTIAGLAGTWVAIRVSSRNKDSSQATAHG